MLVSLPKKVSLYLSAFRACFSNGSAKRVPIGKPIDKISVGIWSLHWSGTVRWRCRTAFTIRTHANFADCSFDYITQLLNLLENGTSMNSQVTYSENTILLEALKSSKASTKSKLAGKPRVKELLYRLKINRIVKFFRRLYCLTISECTERQIYVSGSNSFVFNLI